MITIERFHLAAKLGRISAGVVEQLIPDVFIVEGPGRARGLLSGIDATYTPGRYLPPHLDEGKEGGLLRIHGDALDSSNVDILRGLLAYSVKDPEFFSRTVAERRVHAGLNRALYLPGGGVPHMLPIYVYMGIDLFDSSHLDLLTAQGIESHPFLGARKSDLAADELRERNLSNLAEGLRLSVEYIKAGRIRELAELCAAGSPEGNVLLRTCDSLRLYHSFYPASGGYRVYSNTRQSFDRPDISMWVKGIIDSYRPPVKDTLVLLPCSARKPYSLSKSHRRFREAIGGRDLHEVILTSPLGVVPRELEATYPAANYDIPVAGQWYPEESMRIVNMLDTLLEKGSYRRVVVHFNADAVEGLKDILESRISDVVFTVKDGRPTSQESLENLRAAVEDVRGRYRFPVEGLASYQFGSKAWETFASCSVKGRVTNMRFILDNKQIGTYTAERGLISLTLEGARMVKLPEVEVAEGFRVSGSVLAPGITDADPSIRPGQEVAIVRNGDLVAVGTAIMSGQDMKNSTYGSAVKVRASLDRKHQ